MHYYVDTIFLIFEKIKSLKNTLIAGPPNLERVRGPGASAPFAPWLIHHCVCIFRCRVLSAYDA